MNPLQCTRRRDGEHLVTLSSFNGHACSVLGSMHTYKIKFMFQILQNQRALLIVNKIRMFLFNIHN